MVVQVEARKLSLPSPNLVSLPSTTSLLFDPISLTLALRHSDSSISLYPSFSPFSIPSSTYLPPPQTLIPSPCSSSCFLSLTPSPTPTPPTSNPPISRSLFVAAGPADDDGSKVSLRFYLLLKNQRFVKAKMSCTQTGLDFDPKLGVVVVDVCHGVKVMMVGSVNYFALYSVSAEKILVFGVRMVEGAAEDGVDLRLVKCAVIGCCSPVSAIRVAFGWLILGELNGVRFFPLRKLVKGRVGSRRKRGFGRRENAYLNLPNGVCNATEENADFDEDLVTAGLMVTSPGGAGDGINVESSDILSGGNMDGKPGSLKLRSLKLQQDSGELGMCFVPFNVAERSAKSQDSTTEAISIQALSRNKFLIVDSNGNLSILHLPDCGPALMRHLSGTPQVCQAAVFPDSLSSGQTLWVSDGSYSVLIIVVPDEENANGNDSSNYEVKLVEVSVSGAIFVCESIQDIVLLASNTILILGQDNLYAYSIS
ncbi:hypothetical protein Dimus_033993 [Dionaea muscipula]